MNPTWISTVIAVAGFVASIGVSTFLSGMRWGIVTRDIEYLRRDITAIMQYFRLSPANDQNRRGQH